MSYLSVHKSIISTTYILAVAPHLTTPPYLMLIRSDNREAAGYYDG